MISVKSPNGCELTVDENALDDWDVVCLAEAMDTDGSKILPFARAVFGVDQVNKLADHNRNESGKVTFTVMTTEIIGAINAIKAAKNSYTSQDA